jgi:hypothetical protein
VLRDFFGIATPRQRADLTLGLDEIVLEDEAGGVLRLPGTPTAVATDS